MTVFDAFRALGALILVIGIILALAWLARRYGAGFRNRAGFAPSDLAVVEWRTLDVRRKLAVVRWDGREHLLCLGPVNDVVIAHRTAPVGADGARAAAPAPANDGETH